jgi:hypothetical protein
MCVSWNAPRDHVDEFGVETKRSFPVASIGIHVAITPMQMAHR